jgi:hypothetical protein
VYSKVKMEERGSRTNEEPCLVWMWTRRHLHLLLELELGQKKLPALLHVQDVSLNKGYRKGNDQTKSTCLLSMSYAYTAMQRPGSSVASNRVLPGLYIGTLITDRTNSLASQCHHVSLLLFSLLACLPSSSLVYSKKCASTILASTFIVVYSPVSFGQQCTPPLLQIL